MADSAMASGSSSSSSTGSGPTSSSSLQWSEDNAPGDAINYNPAWRQLVSDFHEGGLTPAQYAAFVSPPKAEAKAQAKMRVGARADLAALAGIFVLLLIGTTILAIHSTRRANAIEAESAMAAIGRWKDAERDIVKSVPEPPRLYKSNNGVGGGGGGGGGARGGGGGGRRVLAHMRRFSEDHHPLNTRRERERQRQRSRSVDKGRM